MQDVCRGPILSISTESVIAKASMHKAVVQNVILRLSEGLEDKEFLFAVFLRIQRNTEIRECSKPGFSRVSRILAATLRETGKREEPWSILGH
jgi:hypothetical protein